MNTFRSGSESIDGYSSCPDLLIQVHKRLAVSLCVRRAGEIAQYVKSPTPYTGEGWFSYPGERSSALNAQVKMWDNLPIRRKPFLILAKYKTRLKRLRQQMVFRRAFLLQDVRTSNTRPDSWSDKRGKGRLFPNKTVQLLLSGRSVVPRSAPRRSALLRLARVSAALLRLAPLRSLSLRFASLRSVSLRSAI